MELKKVGFPSIVLDNDSQYIAWLSNLVQQIDPDAKMTIINGIRGYTIGILPSNPCLKKRIRTEVEGAHSLMGLIIELSRTIDYSGTITFFLAG